MTDAKVLNFPQKKLRMDTKRGIIYNGQKDFPPVPYAERLAKVRASLERINTLMEQLRKLNRRR